MSMLKCKAESASKHWTSRCGNVYIEGGIISPRNHGLGLGLGLAAHGLGLGLGLGTTGLDYKTANSYIQETSNKYYLWNRYEAQCEI